MRCFTGFYVVILMVLFPLFIQSEEIANYAGCDVCNGAIHLTMKETKDLLGLEGVIATLKLPLPNSKKVKIDLDGKLENGTKDSAYDGYEIEIWGSEIFFIKDLRDESVIQMLTSRGQLPSSDNMQSYKPHIFLDAGHTHGIDLKDSVDVAWKKMRHTNIYKWVGEAENKDEWLLLLREKIFQAMEIMNKAK